jgi:hypothetical protein
MGRGWRSVVIAVAGVAAACSESSGAAYPGRRPPVSTPEATYIGLVEGGETRIAFVQAGPEIQAYVCGHGETLDSHTRWFEGELEGPDAGSTELIRDDWRLRVVADGSSLNGELIAPGGEALSWSAARVSVDPTSEVGLYESFDTGCRSGVIVWEAIDGPECRAQGAWCDSSGTRGQVTPADCAADEPLRVFGNDSGDRIELIAERVRGQ